MLPQPPLQQNHCFKVRLVSGVTRKEMTMPLSIQRVVRRVLLRALPSSPSPGKLKNPEFQDKSPKVPDTMDQRRESGTDRGAPKMQGVKSIRLGREGTSMDAPMCPG